MAIVYFGYSSNYQTLRLSSLGYPAGTVYRGMFDSSDDPTDGGTIAWKGYFNPHATQIRQVIIEDEISLDYANNLFDGLTNCTRIDGLNKIRGNLLNTTRMFADTPNLNQDLTFANMISINCLDATEMFANSGFRNIILDNINMKNCTSMKGMFKNAKAQTVEMTSINTQSVRYADEMFKGCSNLTNIYATGGYFDFAQSITSNDMFDGATLLTNFPNMGTDKNGAISVELGGYIDMSPNSLEMVDVRIQLKYDSKENWLYYDPTPLEGELCIESDTLKFKVGDGSHHYSELSYMYGFRIDDKTIIEDSESNELKVPIDEETIIVSEGKLKSVEKLHADQLTIMSDGDGLLYLDLDNKTIKVGDTGKLESVTAVDNKTIKEGATGLYVPIDQVTLYVDPADGLIKSKGDLTPGKGLEWNASSPRVLDIRVDNKTITTSNDGPTGALTVSYDGQTIYWDAGAGDNGALKAKGITSTDQSVTVSTTGHNWDLSLPLDNDTIKLEGGVIKSALKVDGESIILSEGKLSVNVDGSSVYIEDGKVKAKGADPDEVTIKKNSEGKLEAVKQLPDIDEVTIIVNSEGKLEAVKQSADIDEKTIVLDKDNKISVNIDNETITYNSEHDYLEVTNWLLETESGIYAIEDSETLRVGVNVDNKTIIINSEGQLEGAPNVLTDDKTILKNSENVISVNIDNDTIVYDEEENWLEVPHQTVEFGDGLITVENSEGIVVNVNVDEKTIFINDSGQLEGAPNVLVDDKTINIDSENIISVNIDNTTIVYDEDEDHLEVPNKYFDVENGLYLRDDSETLYIGIDLDGETLFINSEGKLEGAPNVLVDNETIIQDENDVISVHYDHDSIVYDSEDGLEVNGFELTPVAPIYIIDNSESNRQYLLGCGYDNTTIVLNENNELCTEVGGGWKKNPDSKIIATGTNVSKKRHHMLPDDDADYILDTIYFPNYLRDGKTIQVNITHDAAFMDESQTLTYDKKRDMWIYDGRRYDSEAHELDPHGYSIFVKRDETVVQLHEDFEIDPDTLTCTIMFGGSNWTKEYINNDFINVDNRTIFVNSEGQLQAGEQLEQGKWIKIENGQINMGNLCKGLEYNSESDCIALKAASDSEFGGVTIDGETLKLNDEGKLKFDIDNYVDRGLDLSTGKIGHTNEFTGNLRQAGDPTSTVGIKWDDQGHLQEVERYAIPTYIGASQTMNGTAGFVPAAPSGEQNKFLRGDGTWASMVEAGIFSIIETTGSWYVGTDRRTRVISAAPTPKQLVIAPLGFTVDRDAEAIDCIYATDMTLGHQTICARSNTQSDTLVTVTCKWLVVNM